jgi:insulysin
LCQSSPCCGLRLSFKGYDDKMALLIQNVMSCIASFNIEEHQALFEMLKEKTICDYRNRRFQQAYLHAITSNNLVQEKPFWSSDERLHELETLQPHEVQACLGEFLSSLLIESMIVGNMTAEEAREMMRVALAPLSVAKLAPENVPSLKTTKVQEGVTVLHEQLNPDPEALDSSISVYVQVGPRSVVQDVTLELLCQILDKDLYGVLRTQEQLGYVVAGVATHKWQVGGVRFIIQGVMDPEYLEGRLESFLHLFEGKLASLEAEDFAEHVQSLITKKSEKDRNVDRHCERLMTELCSHTYVWNRKELEVKALSEITLQNLVDFFVRHISVKSPTRRRICSHVVGRAALDVLKEAGVEPSVKPESAQILLVFPPGSVPFPLPPAEGETAEPPALPEPSVTTVAEYKKISEDYCMQK